MPSKKRYQIFISSTFKDLEEERWELIQAILELGHIPVGMELFPSSGATVFEYIKKVIDRSDYYVVVIANRYGSLMKDDQLSFTEAEYDYADSKGVPIISLIHRHPDNIPAGRSELDPALRGRLEAFRKKVSLKLPKYWETPHELAKAGTTALVHAIEEFPRTGWIRADQASEDLDLKRRKIRHVETPDSNGERTSVPDSVPEGYPIIQGLAGPTELVDITGHHLNPRDRNELLSWKRTMTWGDLWGEVAPAVLELSAEGSVSKEVGSRLFLKSDVGTHHPLPNHHDIWVNWRDMETFRIQFEALGLVTTRFSDGKWQWTVTALGLKSLASVRAIRSGTYRSATE